MKVKPKSIGLWLGPLLFAIVLWSQPLQLKPGCNEVLAVAAWMICWWIFEAVPLAVAALLPIVLFSSLGVMKLDEVLVSYADKVLYLFFGGFVLALGLETHNLHKRIALIIIRMVGLSAPRLLMGFLLATAFLSMWISNTATAVMMLPMAMSCLGLLYQETGCLGGDKIGREDRNFAAALMLAIAYGANIGGMATVIGTPPNLFMRGFFADELGIEISFFQWMIWGVPIALVLLALAHWLLAYWIFPCANLKLQKAEHVFTGESQRLGPMQPVHWRMLAVFVITTFLWMFRSVIQPYMPVLPLTGKPIPLSDEIIAVAASIALFVLPGASRGQAILDWDATKKLPWGILLLFGGGIALAKAMEQTGVLEGLSEIVQHYAGEHPLLLIILLTTLCLYLTEVMSNIALVQVMIPIICAIAVGVNSDAFRFALPATFAASCAFMLPMATPPNGIVFGSGKLNVWDMIKAGFWLNLVSLIVILLLTQLLLQWFQSPSVLATP